MLKIIVNNIENPSDKKKAFKIRDLVFCKGQKVSKKIEFDGLDEICDHYLAKINELPIGTARIREEKKGTFKIERMAVLKEYRKIGVGSNLIIEAEKILQNSKTNLIWLNAREKALSFYLKNGYQYFQ